MDAAAQARGRVDIPAGTWRLGQAVKLPGNLTIQGDGAGTVLEPTPDNRSKPVLFYGDSRTVNLLVRNLVFDGGGADSSNGNAVIAVTGGKSVIFDHITVRNARGQALLLQGGMRDSGVRDSHFLDIGNHWKASMKREDRLQGVLFCCGSGNVGNFAAGNRFEDIGLDALQASDQDGFIARGNTFNLENRQLELLKSPDYAAAIFPLNSSGMSIDHNVIHGAQGNGIDAPGLRSSTISDNTVTDCGSAGIGLFEGYDGKTQTSNIIVSGNTISNNGRWKAATFNGGITISGGTPGDIAISGNTITDTQASKTQGSAVQIRTPIHNLRVDATNNLSGNRAAVTGAEYCSGRCDIAQPEFTPPPR